MTKKSYDREGPYYINWKPDDGPLETIDEFATKEEAEEMLGEYRMAYQGGTLGIGRTSYNWE